jgi:TPR repeat protein
VAKDLAMARSWFEKSSDQENSDAQRYLGVMMATGQGGPRDFLRGVALVGAAAEKGDGAAIKLLERLHPAVDDSWF